MTGLTVKTIPFMGTGLCAAQDINGQIWVGVSYICNGIGLSKNEKDRQVKNVQSDEALKRGCGKFDAGVFDPHNATIALQLEYLPLWLAKISVTPTMKEDNPDLADMLVEYQLRAKDVLAEAFIKPAPTSMEDILIYQLQEMKNVKAQMSALGSRVDGIREIVALNPNDWRTEARALIVRIAQSMGGNDFIRDIQHEVFTLVNERAGVNLERRLINKRQRMALEGASKSQCNKLTKVDIIADDRKLIEIYIAVVKEMAIKYDAPGVHKEGSDE